jgi:hypothetical protein
MRQNYSFKTQGEIYEFVIETDHAEVFLAFEKKMELIRRVKNFYTDLKNVKVSNVVAQNFLDINGEAIDFELQSALDQ